MRTVVYLIRHGEPFNIHKGIELVDENILFSNIKTPLSINGEKMAEKMSLKDEFSNLDVVWSSHYTRALSTAKYFAFRNNIKVNIDERFGERVHGCVESYSELPDKFEIRQLMDANFKMPNGESRLEVRERMLESLLSVIKDNIGKNIAIFTHSTAMIFLLLKWCDISFDEKRIKLLFKEKVVFDKEFDYCETFKLVFENNDLVSIENI